MKRKNIVISSLALMISMCLMVFGVYSASENSLSVTGLVEYSVTDVKVLVQGKVNGGKGMNEVEYPAVNESYASSVKVPSVQGEISNQYLGYTAGGGVNNAEDDLWPWAIGDILFEESATGVGDIEICLKFSNYSPYNVAAKIEMSVANDNLGNVERVVKHNGTTIAATGGKTYLVSMSPFTSAAVATEIVITYSLLSDSVSVSNQDVGMSVTFAKCDPPVNFSSGDYSAVLFNDEVQIISYNGEAKIVEIPATMQYEEVSYPVTELCDNAFCGDTNLCAIYVPTSVQTVANSAFGDCANLVTIYSGQSATASQNTLGQAVDSQSITSDKTSQDFWEDMTITLTFTAELVKHTAAYYYCNNTGNVEIYINETLHYLDNGDSYELSIVKFDAWEDIIANFGIKYYLWSCVGTYYLSGTADNEYYEQAIHNLTGNFVYKCYYSDNIFEHKRTNLSSDNPTFAENTEIVFYYMADYKQCFASSTLILCYDNKKKKYVLKMAKDVTYEDDIVVWNFDEGRLDTAKALFITKPRVAERYTLAKFSDGSQVKFVGPNDKARHRIFNIETGKFEYVGLDMAIGTKTLSSKGEIVTLTSIDFVSEEIEYMNIITNRHINCFTNGILSSNRMNNIYNIKDDKFVKDDRKIRPITEFAGIDKIYYDGLRLGEQPTQINRSKDLKFDNNYKDFVDRLVKISKPRK